MVALKYGNGPRRGWSLMSAAEPVASSEGSICHGEQASGLTTSRGLIVSSGKAFGGVCHALSDRVRVICDEH